MVNKNTKKVNKPEMIHFSIRVPRELNDYMQEVADRTGISKNSLIVTKLWEIKQN